MPPTILPYVQAVKRAPVARTPAADAGLGEWIDGPKRPLYRREGAGDQMLGLQHYSP